MNKETAELRRENGRLPATSKDDEFSGIAAVAQCRRWLRKSLREAMRDAIAAEGAGEREAHKARVKELRGLLRPRAKQ